MFVKIEFDNNASGVFYPGQVVSGKVTTLCNLPKPYKVLLEVSGKGYTRFELKSSEEAVDNKGKVFIHTPGTLCRASEVYLENKQVFIDGTEGNAALDKPDYKFYNFSVQLPEYCPTSFESWHGYIRYSVRLTFVIPWRSDQKYCRFFTVIRLLDLNYERPSIWLPAHRESTFQFNFFKRGSLTVKLFLPQKAYLSGQNIPLLYLLDNQSQVNIKQTRINLIMLVTYYSADPKFESHESYIIGKQVGLGVGEKTKQYFNCGVKIPPTHPTCYSGSNLIHVEYELELEARPSGLFKRQSVRIPITIGNIPLRADDYRKKSLQLPNYSELFSEDETFGLETLRRPSQFDTLFNDMDDLLSLPPPSYDDVVHFDLGTKKNRYLPKYPKYEEPSPEPLSIEDAERLFPSDAQSETESINSILS